MRYTLRLLTAQQFMRASGMICAMEIIRLRMIEELGKDSFSIGVWLGRDNTPNRNDVKSDKYSALQVHTKFKSKGTFILFNNKVPLFGNKTLINNTCRTAKR